MRRLDSITDSMDMSLSKFWKIVKEREKWCDAVHGVTRSQASYDRETEQQQHIYVCVCVCVCVRVDVHMLVAQLCLTLCDPCVCVCVCVLTAQ